MNVKLQKYNGAVKINIDGNIYEPLSFKSFRPTAKNISDFYKAGVRVFDILTSGIICLLGVPYSLYGESWVDDDTYDFEPIDKQIDLFIQNAPDAYFALMIQLDTREWYCKKHKVPYTFTHLSQEIADEEWKKAAKKYLCAVIDHVEQKYGNSFYGYFLLCGMTTEWFSHADNEEAYPTKTEAYKKYMGDVNAEIPPMDEREIPACKLLVDPTKNPNLVTYRQFHSKLISDTICEFAHVVKEKTNYSKLCGVYYGYLFELSGPRLWNAGSLDYETVYNCPDVDMISSPSAYGHRAYDSVSAVMITSDTLDIRDKLYFLEFDHITHLAPQYVPDGNGIGIPGYDSKFQNENQTIDVMRRDFMLCCARRLALWWFDMFEGWFYSDGMMNEVARFVEIQKKLSQSPTYSNAEVCVIAEGLPSLSYVNKNAHYNTTVFDRQREGLGRMGAPYDIYSVCDLDKLDYDAYKLFIFLDEIYMSESTKEIIESKIKTAGKTILWYCASGAITDGGISEENASKTVGMKIKHVDSMPQKATAYGCDYGRVKDIEGFVVVDDESTSLATDTAGNTVLALKESDGVKNIFTSFGDLPGKVLTEILKIAGVHVYTPNCPTYVNNSIIGLYMNKGEDETISVKQDGKYVDLFTGNVYESDNCTLNIPSGEYRSVLLQKI